MKTYLVKVSGGYLGWLGVTRIRQLARVYYGEDAHRAAELHGGEVEEYCAG